MAPRARLFISSRKDGLVSAQGTQSAWYGSDPPQSIERRPPSEGPLDASPRFEHPKRGVREQQHDLHARDSDEPPAHAACGGIAGFSGVEDGAAAGGGARG